MVTTTSLERQINGYNVVSIACLCTEFDKETKNDIPETAMLSDLTYNKILDVYIDIKYGI